MNKDMYKPIPIYNNVSWDLTSEACHILLIYPSGAGKTVFICYLAAMVLKRGHKILLIDVKNTRKRKEGYYLTFSAICNTTSGILIPKIRQPHPM